MGTLREVQYTFLTIPCSVLLRMRNVLDKNCRRNHNTIFCSTFFFRKLCRSWDNVEKYCRTGQATDGIMPHVHCMLDN